MTKMYIKNEKKIGIKGVLLAILVESCLDYSGRLFELNMITIPAIPMNNGMKGNPATESPPSSDPPPCPEFSSPVGSSPTPKFSSSVSSPELTLGAGISTVTLSQLEGSESSSSACATTA